MEKIILSFILIPYTALVWVLLKVISCRSQQIIVGCILLIPIIITLIILFKEDKRNEKHKATNIKETEKPSRRQLSVNEGPCVERCWSLIDFAKKFDRMKVGNCTNHTTGEVFTCCIFFKDTNLTFVYFYKDIGVLTRDEIAKRKDKLKVGINAAGTYYLYEGKESFPEPVDLGL